MQFRTRKMVMDRDLNPAGTLFGGRALEWIDEEAAIFAYCQLEYPTHLVTKLMSEIDFKAPAFKGDIIEIGMFTKKIGTTSITVSAVMRNKRTQQEILKIEKIVFVNLDSTGKPMPHNVKPDEMVQIQPQITHTIGNITSPGTLTTTHDGKSEGITVQIHPTKERNRNGVMYDIAPTYWRDGEGNVTLRSVDLVNESAVIHKSKDDNDRW
jgi:acyl-CoA hydrolase